MLDIQYFRTLYIYYQILYVYLMLNHYLHVTALNLLSYPFISRSKA
jgi:hypothetical protein